MKRPHFSFRSLLCVLSLCGGLVLVTACGGSDTQEAEKDRSTSSDMVPGGLGDAMKQMEQTARELQEGKTVEVVNFRELRDLLPTRVAGLDRTKAEGQSNSSMGFSMSQAEGQYGEGEARAEVSLVDVGGVSMGLMGLAAWSMTSIDRESDTDMERTFTFQGQKAYQKYNFPNKRGEMMLIVKDRYVASVKTYGLAQDVAAEIMGELDLSGLPAR